MKHEADTADRIAELLVHLGRTARSEDGSSTLTAAQWTCLRFFARANGSTRTPSSFASFQATTRGTASQIIKGLEAKGLLRRSRSAADGRSARIDLTEAGQAALAQDPLGGMIDVIARLDAAERAQFLETLSRLAFSISSVREVPAFGTCHDCSHFTPMGSKGESGYCSCMAAELVADETTKLCASFTLGEVTPPTGAENDER